VYRAKKFCIKTICRSFKIATLASDAATYWGYVWQRLLGNLIGGNRSRMLFR